MEKFKKQLKTRIKLGGIYCILIPLLSVLLNSITKDQTNLVNASDFVMGFAIGIDFIVIVFIFKYNRLLKNEATLKKFYIKEHDERELAIRTKVKSTGIMFILAILILAMLISGFLNQIVFFTLLGVVLFSSLVMLFLKLYYHQKI